MTFETSPALVGLAGVIVGGAIQASVQLFLARRNHSLAQKSLAYLTYHQGLAASSYAQTPKQIEAAHALLSEGQGLVALYGSAKAVMALAALRSSEDVPPVELYGRVFQAMREDISGGKSDVDSKALYDVMFISESKQ
jgi:hypothetical protein